MRAARPALAVAALVALLAPTLPAAAQSAQGEVTTVTSTDPDILRALTGFRPLLGFTDANSNGILDSAPDEPAYLDLDESKTVTYGDLRLTAVFDYPAATRVDLTNRDFGWTLLQARGWFARAPSGAWVVDTDDSGTLTAGDIRISGPEAWTKVTAAEAAATTPLTKVQGTLPPSARVGYVDQDLDGRRGPADAAYVDLDADTKVTPGDLRITIGALAPETAPTRAEHDAAVAQLQEQQRQLEAQRAADQQAARDLAAAKQAAEERAAALEVQVANLGLWLTILTLVSVVGIAVVAWYARSLHAQHAAAPRGSRAGDEFR